MCGCLRPQIHTPGPRRPWRTLAAPGGAGGGWQRLHQAKGERDVHYSFGPGSSLNIARGRGTATLIPDRPRSRSRRTWLAGARRGTCSSSARRVGQGGRRGDGPASQESLVAVPYAWVARRSVASRDPERTARQEESWLDRALSTRDPEGVECQGRRDSCLTEVFKGTRGAK